MRSRYAVSLFFAPALVVVHSACDTDGTILPASPSDAGARDATSADAQASPDGSGGGGDSASDAGNAGGGDASDAGRAPLQHVFLIVMAHHATSEIYGNTADAPFFNQLAGQGTLCANYFGVTHPGLPNYLALLSGDFQGVWDGCPAGANVTCAPTEFVPDAGDITASLALTDAEVASATSQAHLFSGMNLVDELEAKGLTWKAYMQSIPGVGDTSASAPVDTVDGGAVPRDLYVQAHDPFMYFADIRSDAARMQNIVPFTELASDLAGASVPSFLWIGPDQCHDMRGLSADNANAPSVGVPGCATPDAGLDHGVIQLGDAFLSATVAAIQASPAWEENSALVIVWDEDDDTATAGCCGSPVGAGGAVLGGGRAPALIVQSQNPAGAMAMASYNHYAMLATLEEVFGVPCLGNACNVTGSGLMTSFFQP